MLSDMIDANKVDVYAQSVHVVKMLVEEGIADYAQSVNLIKMPEDMPQYPPLPPGEWMPLDHPARIQWDEDEKPAALEEGHE